MTILALDHVIIGGPDLAELSAWFEAQTGVTPMPGGAHIGLGTRNALVSTGPETYLELLAPDPEQHSSSPMAHRLTGLAGPTAAGWALHGGPALQMASSLRAAGLEITERSMSRAQPGRGDLAWDLVFIARAPGPVIPFLIDWREAPSPARSAPEGVRLERLTPRHPDPAAAQVIFDRMGFGATVEEGVRSGPSFQIVSSKGIVEIEP